MYMCRKDRNFAGASSLAIMTDASMETKPQTAARTNRERLDALSDEEIDTSDIPALTDEDFTRSTWRLPASSRSAALGPVRAVMIEVAVDEDILA